MKRFWCLLLALVLCTGPVSAALASEELMTEPVPAETPSEEGSLPEKDPAEEDMLPEEMTEELPAEVSSDEELCGEERAEAAASSEEELPSTVEAPAEDGAGSVLIDEAHFPDSVFRKYVSDCIDANRDGTLDDAERAAVTEISIGGNNPTAYDDIKSFAGLRYFPELKTFSLRFIGRKWIGESTRIDLDLSGNPALTTLSLYCTIPQKLDLSGNPGLTTLDCYDAGLTELDVSGCPALTELSCYLNRLTALDLSNNRDLQILNCGSNELTALDLSGNPGLTSLNCRLNALTELDVSGCPLLTELDCWKTGLTELDVSGCPALTVLYCNDNQITKLDLSGNPALKDIRCYDNALEELYLGSNAVLEELHCENNRLVKLDVSGCAALTDLVCSDNCLPALDLTKNTALGSLQCQNNELTRLDIRSCRALCSLYCYGNRITALDVSGTALTAALERFVCRHGAGCQWYRGFGSGVYYSLVTDDGVVISPAADPPAAEVGSVIRFGRYEQDNDLSNGPEPIEWIVLDRDGDRLLVISKYILEKKPLHEEAEDVSSFSWADCTLRTWLNGSFMDAAFTEEEKACIRLTPLDTKAAAAGTWYNGRPGSYHTEDHVFLLSSDEAEDYFPDDYHRVGVLTPYAFEQEGATFPYNVMLIEYDDPDYVAETDPERPWFVMERILQRKDCMDWTLRNMDGRERYDTAWVDPDGSVWPDCGCMMYGAHGVRPAMWITYDPARYDPYDPDSDGAHTVKDAALLLGSAPWKAAQVLLDVLGLRALPQA